MRRSIALAIVLMLCAGSLSAIAAPLLKSLNVRAAEVAHAATLFAEDVLTPAAAAKADKESPATYARFGMLGNDDRLIEITTNTLVLAELYQFKAATGAHAFYARLIKRSTTEKGTVAMPTGPIGDERQGATAPTYLGPQKVPGSYVLFRRGAYVALVGVEGTTKTFPASQSARIAALLDARLKHAS
jgi:hypothetical protein